MQIHLLRALYSVKKTRDLVVVIRTTFQRILPIRNSITRSPSMVCYVLLEN